MRIRSMAEPVLQARDLVLEIPVEASAEDTSPRFQVALW